MTSLTIGYKTDTGRTRKNNQDSFAVVTSEQLGGRVDGLFVVADGMGGYAGGEVASRVTVDTVPPVVGDVLAEYDDKITPETLVEALQEAIHAANDAVWKQSRANPELRNMGTTCVTLLVRGGKAAIGNVGDSRLYRLRAGALTQLTNDHSLVQEHVRKGELTQAEARGSRFRNVITRGVGLAGSVAPDVELTDLRPGDTFLLCSDGLTNMVAEPDIAQTLVSEPDVQKAVEKLVDAANKNGGEDNITAIVVRHGAYVSATGLAVPAENEEDDADFDDRFTGLNPGVLNGQHGHLSNTRRPAKAGALTTVLLLGLVFVLGFALINIGSETYEMTGAFPFVHHKPLPKKPIDTAPPVIDFGKLAYAAPVPVSDKPVRGVPVTCDAEGNVYVVAKQSGRVLRMTPDGKAGGDFPADLVPSYAKARTDLHWATDAQGYLYVSSKTAHHIYKFDPKGTRVGVIGEDTLKAPEGIAVDSKGNLYVVDAERLYVLKASLSPQPPPGTGASAPGADSTGRSHEPPHRTNDAVSTPQDRPTHTGGESTSGRRTTAGSQRPSLSVEERHGPR